MTDIKFGRSKIPEKDLVLYYYARTKFTFGGRSFTREECNDLISWKMKPKPAVVAIQHDIYDIFDDDTHEITKSLEKHAQNHEASLHSELEEILQSLLGHKDSENFRDRMEKLSGFRGKLSDRLILKGEDVLLIHKKPLRVDQLYYFYHLLRYVEDENSKTIEEGQARLFWPKIYGGSQIRESNQVFKTLAGSGNTVTGAIASIMTQKEHSYFANLAVHDWQTLSKAPHARLNKLYQEDCYRIPLDLPTTDPATMAGLTVTAGPSGQAPDPDRDDFPSPPPPDKRARESTDSSSPGSGAGPSKETKEPKEKGKGKGKAPEGKRPRGSGKK